MYEKAIDYLREQDEVRYGDAINALEDASDANIVLNDSPFEEAHDDWNAGNHSKENMEILVHEGLAEYTAYDGKDKVQQVDYLRAHIISGKTLTKAEHRLLQGIYAYLEDINFHSSLEALEQYSGVKSL